MNYYYKLTPDQQKILDNYKKGDKIYILPLIVAVLCLIDFVFLGGKTITASEPLILPMAVISFVLAACCENGAKGLFKSLDNGDSNRFCYYNVSVSIMQYIFIPFFGLIFIFRNALTDGFRFRFDITNIFIIAMCCMAVWGIRKQNTVKPVIDAITSDADYGNDFTKRYAHSFTEAQWDLLYLLKNKELSVAVIPVLFLLTGVFCMFPGRIEKMPKYFAVLGVYSVWFVPLAMAINSAGRKIYNSLMDMATKEELAPLVKKRDVLYIVMALLSAVMIACYILTFVMDTPFFNNLNKGLDAIDYMLMLNVVQTFRYAGAKRVNQLIDIVHNPVVKEDEYEF